VPLRNGLAPERPNPPATVGSHSTAFGPLLLALGHDVAGNYTTPVLILAVMPAAVAVVSIFARAPRLPA